MPTINTPISSSLNTLSQLGLYITESNPRLTHNRHDVLSTPTSDWQAVVIETPCWLIGILAPIRRIIR